MSDENEIPSRVSITYSVDLVEVPDRVKILLNELANSFGGIAKLSRDAGNEVIDKPVEGTKSLVELKTLISKTALRVEDCIEIMIGYIKILQEHTPPQEATAPEETPKKKKKKTTKKKTTNKKKTISSQRT